MKYERLTDSETAIMLKNTKGLSWDEDDIETQRYIRLAELEDKIEAGTLIELPCKAGDTIYYVSECVTSVMTFTIVSINIYEEETVFWDDSSNDWHIEDFGKYVFTTKAEAEKRLEELQKEDDYEDFRAMALGYDEFRVPQKN